MMCSLVIAVTSKMPVCSAIRLTDQCIACRAEFRLNPNAVASSTSSLAPRSMPRASAGSTMGSWPGANSHG